MSETEKKLQEYADTHCQGDRRRAIYELMHTGQEGSFDPYVDELSQEEANFTLAIIQLNMIKASGGEENFRKYWKAEELATKLDTSTQAVEQDGKNPFLRKLLWGLLVMACAVVIPIVLMNIWADATWLPGLQSVLIGLASLQLADGLVNTLRFCRLKRKVKNLPPLQENTEPASYEECLAHYEKLGKDEKKLPITSVADANTVLKTARKQKIKGLLWLPVYLIVILLAGVLAMKAGLTGSIIGCVAVLLFAFWQMRAVWRATLQTRDVVAGLPADDEQWTRMNNRQSIGVFTMLLLCGVYLIAAVVGVMLCISL